MAKSYRSQYLDPRWQKKRLEVMQEAGFKCQACGSSEKMLNVHHKQYVTNRDIWDYKDDQYATLCEDCHEMIHESFDILNDVIGSVDNRKISRKAMAAFLAGWGNVEIDLSQFTEVQREIYESGKSFDLQTEGMLRLYWSGREGQE